jgi:uncharacterized membrane protein
MITHHELFWGWLRLVLGIMQMVLAVAGIITLIVYGLHNITLIFFAGATAAMVISRLIYSGRSGPNLEKGKNNTV